MYMLIQYMHIYKCIQSHIILHQHISVIPVTNIRVSCNKHTINIQIIVKKYMITRLHIKSSRVLPHITIIHVGEETYGHIYKRVFVDLSIMKLLYMTGGPR